MLYIGETKRKIEYFIYDSQLAWLYHPVTLSVRRTADFSVQSYWIYESIVLLKIRMSTVLFSFFYPHLPSL